MFKKILISYNINANENLPILCKALTFSVKSSILLLHLKKCSNMKMLAAYGWCGL